MHRKATGEARRAQIITTYGPGALIDLPKHSAIVGGLDSWPKTTYLEEIVEPRLSFKIGEVTGVKQPKLFAPPRGAESFLDENYHGGIKIWQFPEWFLVNEKNAFSTGEGAKEDRTSRRLVKRKELVHNKYDGLPVTPIRFVRTCAHGHIDDIDWRSFVHGHGSPCVRPLWLDEHGTSGDLSNLRVRCECGKSRSLYEASASKRTLEAQADEVATDPGATDTDSDRGESEASNPLGPCTGRRPWLGGSSFEACGLPSVLLIRTASNAYFPQLVTALSLPDVGDVVRQAVKAHWDDFQIVDSLADLTVFKKKPKIAQALAAFDDDKVLEAITALKHGDNDDRPVKISELEAILAVPEGYGDDVPIDENFHARRYPDHAWRKTSDGRHVEAVYQLHRLREVMALIGFTRLKPVTPDINGEYPKDVSRADLAEDPAWFPAVENRGEGIFLKFNSDEVAEWSKRDAVLDRLKALEQGHAAWAKERESKREFPGGAFVLLHTFSHLFIQSLSMRCGYPISSIRERVYVDKDNGRYGVLFYTSSTDASGTLGGLVQQARYVEDHLRYALQLGSLCSNDPICAHHSPDDSLEQRYLHGAACHGCTLISETSCEYRNDYLDRALVVPTLSQPEAAFFARTL